MKNMKWKIPVTVALLAVAVSLIVNPLLAAPANPTLAVVPSATTCSGLYPGRNTGRAYWGSTTGIYFLGLVGFSIRATYTISFTVGGLYYSNTIILSASETVTAN